MTDIEEMVIAIGQLQVLKSRLEDYLGDKVVRGAILTSDEFIDETRISLNTALQILEKQLDYRMSPQKLIDVDKVEQALG